MYPYSNYNQQQDSRYFSNPQFPEPKSSSSWFGWLLIAIGAGLAGFLFGQRNSKNQNNGHESEKQSNSFAEIVKEEFVEIKQEIEDVSESLGDKADQTPQKSESGLRSLEDLPEEVINKYVEEFDENNYNVAEKLWFKQQLLNRPDLIKKYQKLAQLLGITNL